MGKILMNNAAAKSCDIAQSETGSLGGQDTPI